MSDKNDDPDQWFEPSDAIFLASEVVEALADPAARDRLMEYLGILACWQIEADPKTAEYPTIRKLAEYALAIREQEQRVNQEETEWQRGRLKLRKIRAYLRKAKSPRVVLRRRSKGSKPDETSPT